MRTWEFSFSTLLVLYHLALLAPRNRRPYASNFLAFAAALCAVASLGFEGLRWQILPGLSLLLLDLLLLFLTFSRLRGRLPMKGWWRSLGRFLRAFVASVCFLLSSAFLALLVLFPLPQVKMTGGLPVAEKVISLPEGKDRVLKIWYPAAGSTDPVPLWISTPQAWTYFEKLGGPPLFFQSSLSLVPSTLTQGGRLFPNEAPYGVVVFSLPQGQNPEEFGWLLSDLASRGFVTVALSSGNEEYQPPAFSFDLLMKDVLALLKPQLWLQPDQRLDGDHAFASSEGLQAVFSSLRQLNSGEGLFHGGLDLNRVGLVTWRPLAPKSEVLLSGWGYSSLVVLGDLERPHGPPSLPILSVAAESGMKSPTLSAQTWFLRIQDFHRSDASDSAYLKPYLAFWSLKSRVDGNAHGILISYLGQFFQWTLWKGDGSLFDQKGPVVDGFRVLHQ